MKYTREEAFNETLVYFNGDELASNVFLDKYCLKDYDGNFLEKTPEDMHIRLAKEFADKSYKNIQNFNINENLSKYGKKLFSKLKLLSKKEYQDYIFNYFDKFNKIVPQGRVMAGLGVKNSYRSLSNCLRLPPPRDSYSSIMYTDTMLISSAKRGCGYGLSISNLRPEGSFVQNSSNSSTGAVSFMERYSFSTREVAQNGRRGACLLDIHINHPDVEKFITIKEDKTKVTGANISVKYTDEFFDCLNKQKPFIQRFPVDSDISKINTDQLELNTIKIIDGIILKKVDPNYLFNLTVKYARDNAEPGLFFWDRMINYDPASVYKDYKIDGTNACGEQPMAVYDTCRLILLNLFSFVNNPFTKDSNINYQNLYETSYFQLFLGEILVDLEIEYIDRIINKIKNDAEPNNEKAIELELWLNVKNIAKNGRRVGCGITALGDMVAGLNIKYDSEESLSVVDKVMKTKMEAELDSSIDLSILKGPFKGFDPSLENNDFYTMLKNDFPLQHSKMSKFGRRNVNWSTIAPAGTVSIQTQSTSGCEPLFMPYYTRRVKINPSESHKTDFIDQNGDCWREEIVVHQKLKLTNPNLNKDNIDDVFKKSSYYKATANEIDWSMRLKMQKVLQKYTTSAISTTLNLPNNVTYEEVKEIYIKSWEMGLKGQTIYRDGCRTGVLIKKEPKIEKKDATKRPKILKCDIYNISVKKQKYTVIVGLLDNIPYEVFCVPAYIDKHSNGELIKQSKGKYILKTSDSELELSNYLESDTENALLRMISTALRHGADIKFVVEQLQKTKGDLTSFSKSIARALKQYITDGDTSSEKCKCGSNLSYQEGCLSCKMCGFSKCN